MNFPIHHILHYVGQGTAVAHELGLPVPDLRAAVRALQGGGPLAESNALTLLAAQVAALTDVVLKQQKQIDLLMLARKDGATQ